MDLGQLVPLTLWLLCAPLGAWITWRAPGIRNDTYGGVLGLFLGPLGVLVALGLAWWRNDAVRDRDDTGAVPHG